MKPIISILVTVAGSVVLAMTTVGCIYVQPHDHDHSDHGWHGGPPPHAPAHGYRHKHPEGVEIVFDGHLGIYIVLGYAGYYFHEGHFYHHDDDHWYFSTHLDGPWALRELHSLPPGLQKRKGGNPSGRGKGHKKKPH